MLREFTVDASVRANHPHIGLDQMLVFIRVAATCSPCCGGNDHLKGVGRMLVTHLSHQAAAMMDMERLPKYREEGTFYPTS
jgi:hypothetical protein